MNRPLAETMMAAIAANDSQKPAESGANGSISSTSSSASANGWNGCEARATERANSHTPSMMSVRSVGTDSPASAA